jgi:hypothetical protein
MAVQFLQDNYQTCTLRAAQRSGPNVMHRARRRKGASPNLLAPLPSYKVAITRGGSRADVGASGQGRPAAANDIVATLARRGTSDPVGMRSRICARHTRSLTLAKRASTALHHVSRQIRHQRMRRSTHHVASRNGRTHARRSHAGRTHAPSLQSHSKVRCRHNMHRSARCACAGD